MRGGGKPLPYGQVGVVYHGYSSGHWVKPSSTGFASAALTKSANPPINGRSPDYADRLPFSEYPTLGHTYLLREVRGLRELGWDIQTISIRQPGKRPAPLSPAEQQEYNSTWYVLGSSPLAILAAHLATFASRPARYFRGLLTACKIGRFHPHSTARALAYFGEAVVAGHRLRCAGIERVHSVYTTTVALILSQIFDVRLSMTIHGPSEFFDPEGFRIRDKVAAAELVTGISYFCRSQIMLWSSPANWHKIEVAPWGSTSRDGSRLRFAEAGSLRVDFGGPARRREGLPLLLDAVAQLVSEGRDVRLTLVGDGPDSRKLQEQSRQLGIAERVIFTGWKNQAELRQLYAASDLCVRCPAFPRACPLS